MWGATSFLVRQKGSNLSLVNIFCLHSKAKHSINHAKAPWHSILVTDSSDWLLGSSNEHRMKWQLTKSINHFIVVTSPASVSLVEEEPKEKRKKASCCVYWDHPVGNIIQFWIVHIENTSGSTKTKQASCHIKKNWNGKHLSRLKYELLWGGLAWQSGNYGVMRKDDEWGILK